MVYSDDIDSLQNIRNTVSDIHSVFMWVIITFIVVHIGGVILAELGKNKGIVSSMINGSK
jgi:Ni,Fe-hydrogenase I cytochrome b subunit